MLFRGSYEHAIDLKGRTSVPARFREVLAANYGDKLIATAWFDPCLLIWPLKSWEAFEELLSRRNPGEPGVKQIYRVAVSTASELGVDKLGRILIPSTLRAHAALEKDVVWVGQSKSMQLWSKAGWEKAHSEARSEEHREAVDRVLGELRG
jgi:MraZ protein